MNAAPVIQMHYCKILFCDITSLFEDIKVDEKKLLSQNKQQKKQREEERNPWDKPRSWAQWSLSQSFSEKDRIIR